MLVRKYHLPDTWLYFNFKNNVFSFALDIISRMGPLREKNKQFYERVFNFKYDCYFNSEKRACAVTGNNVEWHRSFCRRLSICIEKRLSGEICYSIPFKVADIHQRKAEKFCYFSSLWFKNLIY